MKDGWNNLTHDQMESQLIRQSQLIGELRSALSDIKLLSTASAAAQTGFALHRILSRIDSRAKTALNLK